MKVQSNCSVYTQFRWNVLLLMLEKLIIHHILIQYTLLYLSQSKCRLCNIPRFCAVPCVFLSSSLCVSVRQERHPTSPHPVSSSCYWTQPLSYGTSPYSTSKQLRYLRIIYCRNSSTSPCLVSSFYWTADCMSPQILL